MMVRYVQPQHYFIRFHRRDGTSEILPRVFYWTIFNLSYELR